MTWFNIQEDLQALKAKQGIKDVTSEDGKTIVKAKGAEIKRRRKVEHMKQKQSHAVREQDIEARRGGGVNWLQLIIVLAMIYGWVTGKN